MASITGETAIGAGFRPAVIAESVDSRVARSAALSGNHNAGGWLGSPTQPLASAVAASGPGTVVTSVVTQADRATGPVASNAAAAASIDGAAAGAATTCRTTWLEQVAWSLSSWVISTKAVTAPTTTTVAMMVTMIHGATRRPPVPDPWRDVMKPPGRRVRADADVGRTVDRTTGADRHCNQEPPRGLLRTGWCSRPERPPGVCPGVVPFRGRDSG